MDALTPPALDPGRLDVMARVAVRVGLNLQPGQDLIVTAPLEAAPLARRVAAEAYRQGAAVVSVLFSDDEIARARFEHAAPETFDRAAEWLIAAQGRAYREGAARLSISGEDPRLLADFDPDRVSRAKRAASRAGKDAMAAITTMQTNWSVMAYPTRGWARAVFPDLPPEAAVPRLFDAIFAASRLCGEDPVADWKRHHADLQTRVNWLNARSFDALRFTGPGTDLTVGLARGHVWEGGSATTKGGVAFEPNIPTEEVFTCPHARRVDGRVRATKPLAYQGAVIEGIEVRFEAGRIVEARAARGETTLRSLLDTDEGARRLGEVALVPASSPIAATGMLFYNTLFDENAASHIALGQCYADTIANGSALSAEELAERGGNSSIVHEDWMIGSAEIDVDGLDSEGGAVPVMRRGEWAD